MYLLYKYKKSTAMIQESILNPLPTIHSFSSLSYKRPVASSKVSSPQGVI
jgi:hypothetical protein